MSALQVAPEKPWIRPCAICGEICSHLGARGRNVVCQTCARRAVDSVGRPICFEEDGSARGNVIIFEGSRAYYREPDPQAGEMNLEVSASYTCWIDGVECHLYEGVAGWIGLVVNSA